MCFYSLKGFERDDLIDGFDFMVLYRYIRTNLSISIGITDIRREGGFLYDW